MESKLFQDDRGRVVETTNADADVVEFCPQGGGFVRKMGHGFFHNTFKPYTRPGFKLTRFAGYDWLPDKFTVMGYTDGTRWNGWACPYFTKEQADTLLPHMTDLAWDDARKVFTLRYMPDDAPEVIEPTTITVDGQPLNVYGIGDGWCWDTVD